MQFIVCQSFVGYCGSESFTENSCLLLLEATMMTAVRLNENSKAGGMKSVETLCRAEETAELDDNSI